MTVPAAPSAIASLDIPAILDSGIDPQAWFTAAVAIDTRRPVPDLCAYLIPDTPGDFTDAVTDLLIAACTVRPTVEAWMSAAGSAAVQAASR